jgi:RNA polymerase sigma factor (TIGR02999 family)
MMADVTEILLQIGQGNPRAADELLPLVYDELRRLAAQKLASEKPGQTLDATALVHEAYLRLVPGRQAGRQDIPWDGRGHFFAAAAEAMRRILVESARRKHRIKHGGGRQRVALEDAPLPAAADESELLLLDEALERLTAHDPQAAELVKLRYFAGLTIPQAAQIVGVSPRKADSLWYYARAWLRREVEGP